MKIKAIFFVLSLFGVAHFLNAQEAYYEVRKLMSNSKLSDFGVTLINDSELIFSSSRDFSGDEAELDDNGVPFIKMYKGRRTDLNDITAIEPMRRFVDLNFHQSNAAFTKDGKTVYFTASNIEKGRLKRSKASGKNLIQLYRAEVSESGDWFNVEKLPFNSDDYQTGHPALNADDSILFFISDRPESTGRTDIFSVYINNDGSFSEPKNLGPIINTNRREMFPYVDPKTNTLYFASDGQKHNLGGLDIYAVRLKGDEVVSNKPYHFDGPINTHWDDFAYISFPNSEVEEGFISSNRLDVKDDNLFYFKQIQTEDCTINGSVNAAGLDTNLAGTDVMLYNANGVLVSTVVTDQNGQYTFTLPCKEVKGQSFTVKAEKLGYDTLTTQLVIDSNGKPKTKDGKPSNTLMLVSNDFSNVAGGGQGAYQLKIDPIYFDYGSAKIKERSVIDMEKAIALLQKYPKLNIRIESHTDTRSSKRFNKKLSKDRAKSVYQWLLNRGIDPKRLDYKGYGESKPLNKCVDNVPCSEIEHLVNRRTNFVIVK